MAGDQAEAAKPEDRRRHFEQADDLQALAALQDEAEAPAFVIAGRYEVLSTLGQGGMGAVYKARDPRLDRTVAIKTILPHYLANPQASRRFFREAQALGRLNHPNILTVYDSGQDGGTHYLVMELGGRDLVRVLERQGGPLPLDEALHVGLALGRALEYAHGHGVIHRDLKPANILIGSPDDSFGAPLTAATAVKVMDFGLAKVQGASALTAPSAQLGTPQYMSPEQVLGREADERADLYSLGVLLYEVCTGVRPFDGDDVRSILSQHLTLEPVPPSAFNETLPQALETLILRLLEKDPTRRPSTAADVLRVLEALARSVMADTGSSPPGSAAPQDGPAAATLPTESGAQRSVPASQFALGRLPARSALVGRGEELEWLRAQYQAVAAGADGRLVLISGEPGVGKTRLTQELGLFARLRGGAFLEGHYLRDSGGPYAPWVEAVRSGLRGLERDELAAVVDPYGADLAQILPELTGQLGPFAPGPRLGPEEQRQRLYDGIVGVLAALSQRAPLVLLLDDLQWAPGLTLLAHVARRLPESRVLLVGAFREQEFNEQSGLVREREEMNRARLFAPLALKLLTAEQTAQLVAHAFGLSVGEALGVQVHHVTHGNAFFVEEVLRGLAESGAVRPGAAGWEAADATRVSIPASLKLAVEGRVERLGDEAREMLAQAAVLGQEFALPVLAAMTRIDEDTLLDHLDRAVRARLLTELRARDEERYAFADDQVQEVLAAGISMARRRRWHVRAGQAIEGVYGDRREPHLEELARHFVEGGDREKGADYSYQAGRKADRLYAWARSIPLYRQALELWEELGGHLEQRAAVYEQLGDASFKSTLEGPNAIGYFQQALALYEQLGDRRKQATIHSQLGRELAFGSVIDRQDIDQGIEHLHQACTILEGLPQSPALSLAYVTLGVAYAALLRTQEQASWTAKALDTAERLRSPVLIAQASTLLGAALDHTGELSRGRTIREQGWQLASEGNFAFQADENRLTNVGMSVNLKDPKTALAWAARRPDYHTTRALAIPMVLVRVYAMLGDFETAVRLLQEQEAVTGATRRDLPGASLVRGELALRRGDWDQAQRHMEAVHQQCLVTRDYRPSVTATPSFAEACVQLADVTRAEERLLWVLDLSRAGGSVANQVRVLPQLGALYVKTDRLVEAEACLRDVQSILAQGEDWFGLVGDVALAEGLVRAAQDRWPEANAAFRRAIEVDQRYELRWDEAKVYYEWGCALIGRGEAGRDEARLHLGRAMDMWEAMGAGPWAEKCRERLAELT